MTLRFCHVDAFADRPFTGNPAGVCLLDREVPEEWMQAVAAEVGLSETAFVKPSDDGAFDLRWFAPAAEVALCGHATLATAHALWELGDLDPQAVARFHTKSGLLTAARRGEWIELDFPSNPPAAAPAPDGLLDALGLRATFVGTTRLDFLVEVESQAVVRALSPDFASLRGKPARGVIVTARAAEGEDFVSRFFAPNIGVNEDPVTGSAHTALAPYWAAKLGKTSLVGRQLSARGGVVRCSLAGDRVRLSGRAFTMSRGEWLPGA